MKCFIYILLLLLLFSCSRKKICCTVVSTEIDMSVNDSTGNDLLDPSFPGSYKEDSIRLYYLVNGKRVEVYDPNMDSPRNFFIYHDTPGYVIRVFPNDDKSSEYPVTYIDWNQHDEDTIRCELTRTSGTTVVTKVWFDGQLKWQAGTRRYFSIIK